MNETFNSSSSLLAYFWGFFGPAARLCEKAIYCAFPSSLRTVYVLRTTLTAEAVTTEKINLKELPPSRRHDETRVLALVNLTAMRCSMFTPWFHYINPAASVGDRSSLVTWWAMGNRKRKTQTFEIICSKLYWHGPSIDVSPRG